jgi:D-serine ammonia-lyase
LHGFYCHAGTSYDSTSLDEATNWLTDEVTAVLDGATLADELIKPNHSVSSPLILSVGSTPTAHAFSETALATLRARLESCHATLELHAGNYPMLDLQQLATSLIDPDAIAQRVIASVIAYYPGRGEGGSDEAMCDAGGIAMSKDKGPIPGFGDVICIIPAVGPTAGSTVTPPKRGIHKLGWRLGRMSQEHGILTRKKSVATGQHIPISEDESLHLGDIVEIVGQHACMTAAAYPWYYIVDSSQELAPDEEQRIVDIWVPYKGW